jgi:hypothetical protein
MRFKLQSIGLIVLLISSLASGQSEAPLRGTVSAASGGTAGQDTAGQDTAGKDNDRTYLPKVQLSLRYESNPAEERTAITDDSGHFEFVDLHPGRCTVKVIDPQFEETPTVVDIAAGRENEVEIFAHVRAVQQNVSVTADQAQVDTSTSDTSARSISQTTLQSAPLISERFQDALPLLPGVVRGPDGLINIKGARAGQSGTLVNSSSAVDPVTGEEAISLPLEAVASVKVLDNPFSAEYGQFAGAVTEVETRSGTDQWKYLVTNLFPRFRWREGGVRGLESITPRFTVAGPLVADKLYLFQSFDYRFVRVPMGSLPPLARDQQFETFDSSTQLDWSASATNHLSTNFAFYPEITKYAELNTFNPESVTPDFHQRGYMLAFHDRNFKESDLLETSFAVKRTDFDVYPSSGITGSLTLYPEQNFGTWYNHEDRNSWMYEFSQVYHKSNLHALGTHLLSLGYSYDHSTYDGTVANQPVIVEREDHTTSQDITFGAPASLNATSNTLAMYVQDHWSPSQRVSLDLGLRVEHDSLSTSDIAAAPRLGFVIAPTPDNKTAIRGGVGLYYDKIPLNIATFSGYPAETVTRFAPDGSTMLGEPTTFDHTLASSDVRLPYSVAWTLQLDREIKPTMLLRLGYEERSTHRDFFVEPVQSFDSSTADLDLMNNGRQRYREFQVTWRWQPSQRATLYTSYVRSYAHGELNTFGQFFGNFPDPVIRPNQFGALPYDAPNRLLFWGSLKMPLKLEFFPVLDVHSGFPFSQVDDNLNFVGQRDSQRFPAFASLDVQVIRPFHIKIFHQGHTLKAGIKVFNATSHFNPRDVQQNIASPNYGALSNSVGTEFRGKLELDF